MAEECELFLSTTTIIELICLILLLLLSAFFSSAETALTTVNRIRMRSLAEDGNKKASDVLTITDNMSKMLSAVLIGNNIANLSASALATSLTIHLFGNYAVGWSTGILTFLVLLFGEITPKTIAAVKAERISLAYSGTIRTLMFLLTPLIFIVNKCSSLFLKMFRVSLNDRENSMTEEELRTVVDVSHEDGVIEKDEHEIFHNVIDFGDTRARDVMIPRIHMIFASADASYDDIVELFREYKFTRLPVYADTTDNVIGILNVKDLLLCENRDTFVIQDVLRDAYFTYENKRTSELLIEMRKESCNLAVVLDEYGETSGLLTLEDLLEEIVGEIHDEYDEDEESPITQIGKREYIAEGSMNLDDFCEYLDLDLASEDYDSLGGFMIEQLDRMPEAGDEIETGSHVRLAVESMDEKRIATVHVYLPDPDCDQDSFPIHSGSDEHSKEDASYSE